MEDRLVLWIPDGDREEAPKKRFEFAEKTARLNAGTAIPVFVFAFAGLLKQILWGEDEKEDESPSSLGSSNSSVPISAPDVRGTNIEIAGVANADIDLAEIAALAKVIRIADYLKSLSGTDPARSYSGAADFTLDADDDILTPADLAQAIARANSDWTSNETARGGDAGIEMAPVANDNKQQEDAAPTAGDAADDIIDLPDEDVEVIGNGPVVPDKPGDGTPTTRLNRAPLLNGPVYLSNGLINLSVIITMGELLAGASDPDGDPLIVRFLEADGGELQRIGLDRWLYTPPLDEPASVSFRYMVSDGTASVTQTAHLEIISPEDETIIGTDGSDILIGTPYADLIDARDGDDLVYGRESNDIIRGGDGNDRLVGGAGDDVIWGGFGDDILFGGDGNDTLFGEEGDDLIYGGDGDDIGLGGSGSDTLFGESGDDVLDGGDGDDTLYGGEGVDVADGGAGDDVVHAGGGDDLLIGGSGEDLMLAGAGDDRLYGGDGDDTLYGGEDDDVADGGDGDDVIYGDGMPESEAVSIVERLHDSEMPEGLNAPSVVQAGSDALAGEDEDELPSDVACNTGELDGDGDDILDGGDGDDVIHGGGGDDIIHGGNGADTLFGDDGDDVLHDGEGFDRIDGGDGDDRIVLVADGDVDEINGDDGVDTLDLSEIIFGSTVDLPDGWVTIDGHEEARLFEIENVRGGSGRDRLVADDEVNIMTGGGGDDTFVFRSLDALLNKGGPSDHIVDFTPGDRIDLSRVMDDHDDFTGQKLFFVGAASARADEIGALTYEFRLIADDYETTVVRGKLFDETNADAQFEIILDGRHELTERDFVLAARELENHDHG